MAVIYLDWEDNRSFFLGICKLPKIINNDTAAMKLIIHITTIILFLLAYSTVFGQTIDKKEKLTALKELEIIKANKIKSKKILCYTNDSSTNRPYKKWYFWYEKKYDRNGNEIATIQNVPYKRTEDTTLYNSNNDKIKWIIFQEKTIISYHYDNNNKLTNETTKNFNDTVIGEIIFKYDSIGNNIEIMELNPENKWKKTLKYDNNSNLVELKHYYNEEMEKTLIKYDNNSNEIECINYDTNGEINTIGISKYNHNDKIIEYISCTYGDTSIHEYFEYNIQGNLVREISKKYNDHYGMSSRYGYTTTYKYNNEQLLIKETLLINNPKKTKIITKYIYEKYE